MGTTTGAAVLLGIAVILQCGYLIESSAREYIVYTIIKYSPT